VKAGGEFIDHAKVDARFLKINTWNDLSLYPHKQSVKISESLRESCDDVIRSPANPIKVVRQRNMPP